MTGIQNTAFFDNVGLARKIQIKELTDHSLRFGIADKDGIRPAAQNFRNGGGMIRLHMLNNQIIQLTSGQRMLQIFKEDAADGLVHRIKENGCIVQKKIRIIGNTIRDGINALEHGKPAVIAADPDEVFCDLFGAIHGITSSVVLYISIILYIILKSYNIMVAIATEL